MAIFPEAPPPPPAPDVARVDPKTGLPTVAQIDWERRLVGWMTRIATFTGTPPLASTMAPTTATLPAAGALNRLVATMTIAGGVQPITWSVDPGSPVNASFAAGSNQLRTFANPCGIVGARVMNIRATDALGAVTTGTLTVTLT